MSWEYALFLLPGLIIGLTVHEAAHAISAKWLGDRNAERDIPLHEELYNGVM